MESTKEACTLVFTEDGLWGNALVMTGTVYCFMWDAQTYNDHLKAPIDPAWPLEHMSNGSAAS